MCLVSDVYADADDDNATVLIYGKNYPPSFFGRFDF